MAAVEKLVARDLGCPDGYYYSNGFCYEGSSWYWWGRWVLAGLVVLFFLFLIVLCGCITARRRRKRGLSPMYGTGWMAPQNKYGPQQQWPGGYGGGYPPQQPPYGPPPKYAGQENQQYGPPGGVNPQYTGTTFQSGDGYYGGHQNEGIQLQPPQNTYQSVYSPPAGPPPGK